jgi:hypothetical protein
VHTAVTEQITQTIANGTTVLPTDDNKLNPSESGQDVDVILLRIASIVKMVLRGWGGGDP